VVRGFLDAVNLVCSALIEGGYANDPLDPGKETNHGVTAENWQRAVTLRLIRGGVTVRERSRDEAVVVYRAFFWDAYRIGELPYPLGLAFFDTIVNHTPVWSIKALQTSVGVIADGLMGTKTILAAYQVRIFGTPDAPGAVMKLLKLRMEHYLHGVSAAVEERFELGWANRLLDILFAAVLAASER